mgnify:CR=1 FL=1
MAALDAGTGKLLWKVHPAGPLRGSPTVAFGAVYVITQNNELHALSSEDGKGLWQESASLGATGVFGVAAPAAGQGTVVAGFSTGELIAYRYENGRVLWSDALARTSLSTSVGVLTDIDADPIIDRGRIYALGSCGNVGWSVQMDRYRNAKNKKNEVFWTGPVLAGNRLWIANTEGDIYQVNAMDGVPVRFADVGSPVSLAPVVANSTLYVLDDGGKISAFR